MRLLGVVAEGGWQMIASSRCEYLSPRMPASAGRRGRTVFLTVLLLLAAPPAGRTFLVRTDVLGQVSNHPNPFDSRRQPTTITYSLAEEAAVTLAIYDLTGGLVREFALSPGTKGGQRGPNEVAWDGRNGAGESVAMGGYIAQIRMDSSEGLATAIRKIGVVW